MMGRLPDWDDDDDVVRWAENASREEIDAQCWTEGIEVVPPVTSAGWATIINVEVMS